MKTEDVPEPWATRMKQRGYTRRDGEPNISALARSAGLAVETARRALYGIGDPSPATVVALVRELGADAEQWFSRRVSEGAWVPPAESVYLTTQERAALDSLVRVMTTRRSESRNEGLDPQEREDVLELVELYPDQAARTVGRPPGLKRVRDEIDAAGEENQDPDDRKDGDDA